MNRQSQPCEEAFLPMVLGSSSTPSGSKSIAAYLHLAKLDSIHYHGFELPPQADSAKTYQLVGRPSSIIR